MCLAPSVMCIDETEFFCSAPRLVFGAISLVDDDEKMELFFLLISTRFSLDHVMIKKNFFVRWNLFFFCQNFSDI